MEVGVRASAPRKIKKKLKKNKKINKNCPSFLLFFWNPFQRALTLEINSSFF